MADWERICVELGRATGRALAYERLCAEQAAEIQDLRAQLASAQEQLQRPPNPEEGG